MRAGLSLGECPVGECPAWQRAITGPLSRLPHLGSSLPGSGQQNGEDADTLPMRLADGLRASVGISMRPGRSQLRDHQRSDAGARFRDGFEPSPGWRADDYTPETSHGGTPLLIGIGDGSPDHPRICRAEAVFVRIAHNRRDRLPHLQPQRGGPWQPEGSPWGLETQGTPALNGRPDRLTKGMHKGLRTVAKPADDRRFTPRSRPPLQMLHIHLHKYHMALPRAILGLPVGAKNGRSCAQADAKPPELEPMSPEALRLPPDPWDRFATTNSNYADGHHSCKGKLCKILEHGLHPIHLITNKPLRNSMRFNGVPSGPARSAGRTLGTVTGVK
jgi:hypothetical protein